MTWLVDYREQMIFLWFQNSEILLAKIFFGCLTTYLTHTNTIQWLNPLDPLRTSRLLTVRTQAETNLCRRFTFNLKHKELRHRIRRWCIYNYQTILLVSKCTIDRAQYEKIFLFWTGNLTKIFFCRTKDCSFFHREVGRWGPQVLQRRLRQAFLPTSRRFLERLLAWG